MNSHNALPRFRLRAGIRLIAVFAATIGPGSNHLLAQPADVEQRQPKGNSAVYRELGEELNNVISLDTLRERYKKNFKEVQTKTDAVQVLAEQLGTSDKKTIASEQRIRLQELISIAAELERLRRSLNKAIGELTLLQGTPSEHAIENELEKDAKYLSLRYQIGELKDQLETRANVLRPGSPGLNQLQQEMALLLQRQTALREELVPRIIERVNIAEGESELPDRRQALLMQRASAQQLANQVHTVEKEYRRTLASYLEFVASSGELEARIAELTGLRKESDRIQAQIKALESDDRKLRNDDKVKSPRDVSTIMGQIRILFEELEKALSDQHDPGPKRGRIQP